jgi:uncharacterized membrane protein YkoI
LVVTENGTILEDERASRSTTTVSKPSVALGDLPNPVRKTVNEESRGRAVVDIDQETWKGQAIYEVEFEQPGRNAHIYVSQNGSLVRDERVGTGVAGVYLGTQLEDLPMPAQKTIKEQAGTGRIDDIDKETRQGQTIYQVRLERDGRDIQLYVDAAGKVITESDLAAGASAAQVLTGTESATKMTVGETPAAVQTAIRAESGTVKEVQKVIKDGKTLYRVEFSDPGKNRVRHFAEDGTAVKD